MKLTFKDLKQQKFTIEAEPSETILSIKEKIAQDKGWDVAQQKLIYSGKILQDQNTVESYKIEEKGFIVCMVSKPKAPAASSSSSTPAKALSTPAPAPVQTPSAPAAPAPALRPAAATVPDTPSPVGAAAATASGTNFNDPSALALGPQREAAISNMESMGFARADIDRAMRAAYYNPDRAVEYLLNGIPDNIQQEQRQAAQAQAGAPAAAAPQAASPPTAAGALGATVPSGEDQPVNLFEAAAQAGRTGGGGGASARSGGGASGAGAGAATAGLGNLDFLRNNPQFQQLRQVVQQQPHMLEPILQQVGAGNPQLAQLIGQNPEQFLELLSENADDDLPPGAQAISVTEEEREAIERLCRLGFERDLVIQAYFACDKNEELAANFLFEQPDEPDDN